MLCRTSDLNCHGKLIMILLHNRRSHTGVVAEVEVGKSAGIQVRRTIFPSMHKINTFVLSVSFQIQRELKKLSTHASSVSNEHYYVINIILRMFWSGILKLR